MKNLKSKVLHILEKYPQARNNDISLTCFLWLEYSREQVEKINDEYYIKMTNLKNLPRESNITRIRAKIQNEENKFLPTEEKIRKLRKINEEKWRFYILNN